MKNNTNKIYGLMLPILLVLSWQFTGSSAGYAYQWQNNAPYYASSYSQDNSFAVSMPMVRPNPQIFAQGESGPFVVQIPQPAAPYIGPTKYPSSWLSSVIDWGWGPIFVDSSIAGKAVKYFYDRDSAKYYGNNQQYQYVKDYYLWKCVEINYEQHCTRYNKVRAIV